MKSKEGTVGGAGHIVEVSHMTGKGKGNFHIEILVIEEEVIATGDQDLGDRILTCRAQDLELKREDDDLCEVIVLGLGSEVIRLNLGKHGRNIARMQGLVREEVEQTGLNHK